MNELGGAGTRRKRRERTVDPVLACRAERNTRVA